jgi:PAS domain S-box-containing protein
MPETLPPFAFSVDDLSPVELSIAARRAVLAKSADESPALVAIFQKPSLSVVYLNSTGRRWLDPENHSETGKFTLAEIMGLSSAERLQSEILLQTAVRGKWTCECTLRDVWGSEFPVKAAFTTHASDQGGGFFCLQATRLNDFQNDDSSATSDHELLHAVLETIPDSLYFKDLYSRFIRVNRALAVKDGRNDPNALLGLTDFDRFTVEHARPAYDDEQRIIRTGKSIIDQEEKETWADGRVSWVSTTKLPLRNLKGQIVGTFGISRDITARKQAEQESLEKTAFLEAMVDSTIDGVLVVNTQGRKILQNRRFLELWKIPAHVAEENDDEKTLQVVVGSVRDPETFLAKVRHLYSHPDEISRDEVELNDGTVLDRYSSPVLDKDGKNHGRIWAFRDITARKQSERENRELLVQLQLAQRLESIGRLAAGVAHEINTPTQFITDNTHFLAGAFAQLAELLRVHRALREAAAAHPALAEQARDAAAAERDQELDYLLREIPTTITQTLDGLGRVSRIVRSLKEFSHPQNSHRAPVNLNHVIDTTLTVSRNEWKYVADVVTDFDPNLPPVPCVVDEFNQVILNLIINAAHAIDSALKGHPGGRTRGTITIRTRHEAAHALVEIEDTGTGISEANRPHIFEPFFTTKDVGKGTGQGLAIVRNVVVKHHQGSIDFTSEVGRGTTFHIRLPLTAAPVETPSS